MRRQRSQERERDNTKNLARNLLKEGLKVVKPDDQMFLILLQKSGGFITIGAVEDDNLDKLEFALNKIVEDFPNYKERTRGKIH